MMITKIKNERDQAISNSPLGGAVSLTLSAIILKVLGLIYKIPLSRVLGDEGMGYFNSAYTVFSLFYLLCTAGVPKAITMLVTESKSKSNERLGRKILSVCLVTFLLISVFVTAALILFSGKLSVFIGSNKARATMIAIAPSIIPVALSGVVRGYLTAQMKLASVAVSQILDGVGKLVFGLLFANYAVRLNLGPELISAFTILGVTVGATIGLVYLLIIAKAEKVGV